MDFEPLNEHTGGQPGWMKRVGLVLGALLVVGLLASSLYKFLQNSGPMKKRVIHEIALIKPPPPPPPPKQEIKPPEPEMKKEEVKLEQPKMDEPKPLENEPPPALKDLGVVGDGVAGSDLFGLEARSGGTDLLQSGNLDLGGNGKGGGGETPPMPAAVTPKTAMVDTAIKMPARKKNYGWYTVQIQQQIQDALSHAEALQGATYKVTVKVWLNLDG